MSRAKFFIVKNDIRRYRRYRHLRVRDVAKFLGLYNTAHVSAWERGHKVPTLRNALRLAAAIGVPVEVLFCDYFRELKEPIINRKRQTNTKTK